MTGRTPPPGELRPALDDLVHRYAALADQRRLDVLVELFSPAGVLVLPTPPERLDPHHEVRGRSAILEHLALLEDLSVTAHELVGQVYDATGPGSATGRVACVAHHVADGRDVVWHLHYDDTYVVEECTWRFARRALHVDFISTHRVSLHR